MESPEHSSKQCQSNDKPWVGNYCLQIVTAEVQMGRWGVRGALTVCMLGSRASNHEGEAVEWPSFPLCRKNNEMFVPAQAWRLLRLTAQQDITLCQYLFRQWKCLRKTDCWAMKC